MTVRISRALQLLAGAALATIAVAPAAAQPQATAVAPLAYTSRTLPNGLRVYAIRDTGSANVSVQVWYDVGSKDDPQGKSGFAHMFEHLMFKATRNLVPEQMDRLTEDVGGYNNASTADDYTNYFEVVPANHLQRLLWAEAERMGSLVVDQANFTSERDVVKEEYRSRVLASPYGKLFYAYLPQISYDVHPYARPGIGDIANLDAATVDDVRAFHATYYRPDNAVLVVAGNFNPADLDRWVDQYFGPIARPATAIPRVTAEEPARTAPRSYTVYEPNTPLPAALISYPAPPASSPDAAAFEVLTTILSTGQSSRLHQSLVYEDRIATDVGAYADIKQARGVLALYAFLSGDSDGTAGEAALRAEAARLRDTPVTAAELAEAKNELLTQALRSRETAEGKAFDLAEAVIVSGDAASADRQLNAIAAVTAQDIQRVARAWLRDESSAAIRYLPAEMKPEGGEADTIALPATVRTAALTAPASVKIVEPASAAERVAPPPPAAKVASAVPAPTVQTLANGLKVVTLSRRDLPIVSAQLVVGGGSTLDPAGKGGLATLLSSTITQGTATRSATEIAQAMEALGASLQSGADWGGNSLGVTVKSDVADPALAILADVARNPAFAAEEVERQRSIAADSAAIALTDPGSLAQLVAARALYGGSPYGNVVTKASLDAISAADVAAAYKASWGPKNATLVLAGDVDATMARTLAEKHFGSWSGGPASALQPSASASAATPRVIVVDMPGAGQAAVTVTRAAISRDDPRWYRAAVANAVLGTGYSSRLNQEIRIKRGLAYGAGSSIEARQGVGPFVASTQTKNETAPEALDIILTEMGRLGREPIPAAELGTRQAVLTGGFGRTIESASGLANLASTYILDGTSLDEMGRYSTSVAAVTPSQAGEAARALLDPAQATVVIVGDAGIFINRLREKHSEVKVIPAASLNLDAPTLG